MSSFFSSAPIPSEGPQGLPAVPRGPGPAIVPRPVEPKRPRKMAGILLVTVLVVAGGLAWYWNTQSNAKDTTGGPIAAVPTLALAAGDLHETVRIAGVVSAERFASIMAPRIQGNRGNYNRGGQGGNGPNGQNNDFNLTVTNLVAAGANVKSGDVVTEFDLTAQQQRLDDYKDNVVQLEANLARLKANLAYSR